jgi:hypothetical protein
MAASIGSGFVTFLNVDIPFKDFMLPYFWDPSRVDLDFELLKILGFILVKLL